VLAWLGCLGAASAADIEARLMSGLDVRSESVPGVTGVNGVLFEMSRVTGTDVPVLFERMLSEWRRVADGSPPRRLRNGDWNIASRIHDGHSQVIQWRLAPSGAELLWSDTDLQARAADTRSSRYVPALCRWNAPISGQAVGHRFVQSTASCAAPASRVTDDFEQELRQQGWQSLRSPSGLRARRGRGTLEAVIQPADEGTGPHRISSTIVMVETHETRGTRPEPRP
jgi:hypothetical protein